MFIPISKDGRICPLGHFFFKKKKMVKFNTEVGRQKNLKLFVEEILYNSHRFPTISLSTSALVKLEISITSLSRSANNAVSFHAITQTFLFRRLYLKSFVAASSQIWFANGISRALTVL